MSRAKSRKTPALKRPFAARALRLSDYGVIDQRAERNKVMLDYDFGPKFGGAPRIAPIFTGLRICGLAPRGPIVYRKTRKGWHVWFFVYDQRRPRKTFTAAELVALQAVLGSDRKRENLNLMRALRLRGASTFAKQRWNLLFSRKVY